jgi:hypothetical protein
MIDAPGHAAKRRGDAPPLSSEPLRPGRVVRDDPDFAPFPAADQFEVVIHGAQFRA